MHVIEATGLTKSYGTNSVLNGIDLAVERGAVLAMLGPNGAGKTTTVRILATLSAPDGGQANVAGYDVVTQRHEVRRRISLTGQAIALDELQTGAENLRMMGRLRRLSGRDARLRASELLEQFDLLDAADRRVKTYSGGMRRRLDLAAGVLGRPEVIFLDEPTTGLDPRSRQGLWDVVKALAASGVTILLTTQYLEEADQLADQIAVVDDGHIVASGTAAALKAQVAGDRLDLQLGDLQVYRAALLQLGRRVIHDDPVTGTMSVSVTGGASEIRAVLDEIDPSRTRVQSFALNSPNLDDVFLALTGHRRAAGKEAERV